LLPEKLSRPSGGLLLLVLAVALAVAVAVSVTFAGEAEAQKKKKKLKSFHVTSMVAQSGFDGTVPPRVPLTGSPYTYSDTNEFVSLDSIRITLTIDDGDTGPGEFDENQLTLGLDGIDTGITLNGFRDGHTDTNTITGVPNHAVLLLALLKVDGQLNATVIDATGPPDDNDIEIPSTSNTTLDLFGKKKK
jgi:hypothetical protein